MTKFNLNHSNRNLYDEITSTIVELLNQSLDGFKQPWIGLDSNGEKAHNLMSKKPYNGINQILLSYQAYKKGYSLNSWMTFQNVTSMGGNIKKGEKSTMIVFYKFLFIDGNGKKLSQEFVSKLSPADFQSRGIKKIPYLKYYNVFNVFQTERLSPSFYEVPEVVPMPEFEKDDAAESLIASTGAKVIYIPGDKACYRTLSDEIQLPLRAQFTAAEGFYEVALHELAHWTGHPTRLNREKGKKFGDEKYAFEELIAELTSAFLCAELGFTKTITNQAAYLKSWITVLKSDNKAIFKAAKLAEQASDFINSFSKVEYV